MASVMRQPASTVAPVLQAKQTLTFAFVLLDLKVIIARRVSGYWDVSISLHVLFSVGCVFHLEMPEEVSYSYTARREYLLLHLFKSPTETFPFPSKLLWSYIQLLHNLLFSNISGCLS